MCQFRNGIIFKDKCEIAQGKNNNHSDLLDLLKIEETKENERCTFVRAELVPPEGEWWADPSTWEFHIDQDILPDWYTESPDKYEKMFRNAVYDWCENHIITGKPVCLFDEGFYLLNHCNVEQICGTAIVSIRDTNVSMVNGNVNIISMSENSHIEKVSENVNISCIFNHSTIFSMSGQSCVNHIYDKSEIASMYEHSRVLEMFDDSVIRIMHKKASVGYMHQRSHIERMCGNSKVNVMNDYSNVTKMLDNTAIECMNDYSSVKEMCEDSIIILMKNQSSVKMMKENSEVRNMMNRASVKEMQDNSVAKRLSSKKIFLPKDNGVRIIRK